jgi:hypothetical protein
MKLKPPVAAAPVAGRGLEFEAMRPTLATTALVLAATASASGQSLFVAQGSRALEGGVAWSVGPFSNGVETHAALSLDGRWDVGFGFNRYAADFGGDDFTTLNEWSPFVRYFLFKENDDSTPVSLAAHAAFFLDDFEGDADGWYVLAGAQLYKKLRLTDTLALYPHLGFSLAGESYSFGQADPDRAVYLTRQFGVLGQITLGTDAWLRVSAEEHSFRRETYRALRVAYVRRF